MDELTRHSLSRLLGPERLGEGLATLQQLQAKFRLLCTGTLRKGPAECRPGGGFYARYFLYHLTPALEEIGHEGWVDRHLCDFAMLAASPALAPCCRSVVLDLFGFEPFHVAVQFNPCSDELVRKICHEPGDRRDHVRQIARDVMRYAVADGTYPPPGRSYPGTSMYTSTDSDVLDLGGWPSCTYD